MVEHLSERGAVISATTHDIASIPDPCHLSNRNPSIGLHSLPVGSRKLTTGSRSQPRKPQSSPRLGYLPQFSSVAANPAAGREYRRLRPHSATSARSEGELRSAYQGCLEVGQIKYFLARIIQMVPLSVGRSLCLELLDSSFSVILDLDMLSLNGQSRRQ
jgi:hypothetical protein